MRKRKILETKVMWEILDYHTPQTFIKNKTRRPKVNVTPKDVARQNEKAAESKLRLLMANNFVEDDYYLTLTFKEEVSMADAKMHMQKFIRNLRYHYNKIKEPMKYIYICEGKGRIHFHMLLNRAFEIPTKLLKQLWSHGYYQKADYQGGAEDAKKLASYFVKEKRSAFYRGKDGFKKRWVASRNLEPPKERNQTLKSKDWRKDIIVPAGFYLDKNSVVSGVNIAGFPYRFYRLIKLENHERWKKNESSTNHGKFSKRRGNEIYKNR